MKTSDLVYTGFNRWVAALNRDSGALVWRWRAPQGNQYVTLLLDGDLLIVSVDGYMYGLDALSGNQLWSNPMTGFGTGVAALASARGGSSSLSGAAAAQAAAAAAAAATVAR